MSFFYNLRFPDKAWQFYGCAGFSAQVSADKYKLVLQQLNLFLAKLNNKSHLLMRYF